MGVIENRRRCIGGALSICKRHILVDTLGLLLSVAVHPADIQDRDGVAFVLNASTRALFPFLERIFADGASCCAA
jgi:hypothetical protein